MLWQWQGLNKARLPNMSSWGLTVMAVPYLRRYNLPCARGERERERERLEYRGWLRWLNYLVRLRWRQRNRYCMGLSMYARKREWERRGVFRLIRLRRQREAGRFNILIDPGSPCYTLTFTTIALRQTKDSPEWEKKDEKTETCSQREEEEGEGKHQS